MRNNVTKAIQIKRTMGNVNDTMVEMLKEFGSEAVAVAMAASDDATAGRYETQADEWDDITSALREDTARQRLSEIFEKY